MVSTVRGLYPRPNVCKFSLPLPVNYDSLFLEFVQKAICVVSNVEIGLVRTKTKIIKNYKSVTSYIFFQLK